MEYCPGLSVGTRSSSYIPTDNYGLVNQQAELVKDKFTKHIGHMHAAE